ncbi:cyclic nucleotide-binding domain-containing thioredoxin-disulfide reductase [Microbacterium sp. 77mftsu3.1]|uniref:FAD-dependent oxidoreductase n=1 Tax=Microbacterium sp. 77mftsu3.1 TaxID=1761802 RepID=UPI000883FC5B|nr:cyclic nucleotide-binding domain-containing thioredoxin-disulfide reductase [Microbacterium sp. 77mftsu3.1]SDG30275.1 thioredoxin reductase (NADPH) [Microbacterium sp. 77mftsu3.1]
MAQENAPMIMDAMMSPDLSDAHWRRLVSAAVSQDVEVGDYVFRTGEAGYDLIFVESGEVEIVRDALRWIGEAVITTVGPGRFAGELGILNGQSAFLSARVTKAGRVHRLSRAALREIMSEDDELCDLILHALWARRESLRTGPAAMTLKFVGTTTSNDFLSLRRFAERLDLVHKAVALAPSDLDTLDVHEVAAEDLPVAYVQGEPIPRATPGLVAERLGLSYRAESDEIVDLVVVGGGPAGLAAAIYGASEGLSTVLLDAVAPGGQAASTSRIENFLGFPFGVSGGDLIGQAVLQALKFGVRVYAPCEAVALAQVGPDLLDVTLSDDRVIRARSAIVTSGAAYRRLALDRWEDFERSGVYYAATPLELRQVQNKPVVVVGGANSAGQAALYLAAHGSPVHLVIRGTDLRTRMSSYLADRLAEDPRVRVHTASQVTALDGNGTLESVTIDSAGAVDARGLFCFIGADPATSWLPGIDRDTDGFIRTGTDVTVQSIGQWRDLGREPFPFETSAPRVFAAGDVRRGSMKRVAAAVGEGSSAVASVHRALAY